MNQSIQRKAHFTREFAIAVLFSHWEPAYADAARAKVMDARDHEDEDGSTSSNSTEPELSSPSDSSPSLPSQAPPAVGVPPVAGTARPEPGPVPLDDVMEGDAKVDGEGLGGTTMSLDCLVDRWKSCVCNAAPRRLKTENP